MNLDLIMHIGLIVTLLVGIIFASYIAALRFNKYYRGKIRLRVKIKQESAQEVEPELQFSLPFEKYEMPFDKANKVKTADIAVNNPLPALIKTDTAAPPYDEKLSSSMSYAENMIHEEHLIPIFKVGDKVEPSEHSIAMTGEIISRHENQDNHRYQYLVNWGKNGVRWAWEDEIVAEHKKIVELDA
jgi:hypothetical protein